MTRSVSVEDAREQIGELLESVHTTRQPVVVEQDGVPYAVLIDATEWEQLRERRLEDLWAVVDRVQARNAHLDPDEVLADVTAVVEVVRQEMYDERQRAARRDG